MQISKGTCLQSLCWSACFMLLDGLLKSIFLAWLFHPRTLIHFACTLRWYLCISCFFNGWRNVSQLKILGPASQASSKCIESFESSLPEAIGLSCLRHMRLFMWVSVMTPACLLKKRRLCFVFWHLQLAFVTSHVMLNRLNKFELIKCALGERCSDIKIFTRVSYIIWVHSWLLIGLDKCL